MPSSMICRAAVAACLLVAEAGAATADRPPARHERASSWRTVVVPAVATAPIAAPALLAPPRPAVRRAPPVETASLGRRSAQPPPPAPRLLGPGHALDGIASYYWQEQMTASGERFDKRALTAAHRTLPFGTRVRVTHVPSGRAVVVRINDRGPFKTGRVIDLSQAAAEKLGFTSRGLAHVRLAVVD